MGERSEHVPAVRPHGRRTAMGFRGRSPRKVMGERSEHVPAVRPHGSRTAPEPTSITELAHEAVEALTPLAHRHAVELRIDAGEPAVVAARGGEFSRVIRNLLDNAIRHSPTGGEVRVAVTNGDVVAMTVHDSGPGFPAEFSAHAFEPFSRADPARNACTGHAGLGLAIGKALVEGHGGSIWIGDGPGGDVHVWRPAEVARS